MYDVGGHDIQATDGEIGHVEDFIIDDETWAIRYLVIDTRNWWPGGKDPGFAVLDRARQLERIESLRQSFTRGHQEVTGIHGGISADSGI